MGKLIEIFRKKNDIFLQRKHKNTNEWQKTKAHRIEKFLEFCESKQVKDVHEIKKKHFDQFVKFLSENKKISDETIRKYAMAINEFVTRAHLQITINPGKAKNRKIEQKANKIVSLFKDKCNKLDIEDLKNLKSKIKEIL